MIEVNLIPDVKQELLKAQRARKFVISISALVGVVMLSVVAILAVYTYVVQTVYSNTQDSNIANESEKLNKVEELSKILTIQNQLTKVSTMHENKQINSRIFDMLAKINPPAPSSVQYTSVTYTVEKQEMRLEGQTYDFPALETFRKTIENANVRWMTDDGEQLVKLADNISITETSYGVDASGTTVLRYIITFKCAEQLFSPSSKNASVSILGAGNVTDSYNGIPRSLFVDKASDLGGQ